MQVIVTRFIELCSTDGILVVNVAEISHILQDPALHDTCMLYMTNGRVYEVSGNPQDIRDKAQRA